jgi:DivIVA domain-containing protein
VIDARPEAHPFAPAVRGYNKEQVDAFIADLQGQLEAARRSAGGTTLADVGEEAASSWPWRSAMKASTCSLL